MPRYLVTTRRAKRGTSLSAREAVLTAPGITVMNDSDPHMVTIEATEEAAEQLRAKLKDTHFVEPEVRRSVH